jgi:DNA repair protein RecO (recombination protein O)
MAAAVPALVLTLLPHGEHAGVLRVLTAEQGLMAGYVPGARSRKQRALLEAGNLLALTATPRSGLPLFSVEPIALRAALVSGLPALAALDWVTALLATTLPEAVPQPRLFAALDGLAAALAAGAPALAIGGAVAQLELLALAELGLGLDLASCAATGTSADLAFVSPKSRQAVSRAAGQPWAARLLPLPGFLLEAGVADADAMRDGLRLSGHFITRDCLAALALPQQQRLGAARARLVAALGKAVAG